MKLTFIILTYNSEDYIANCLFSIIEFKQLNVKIFIVDNGSNDNTLKIIKGFNDSRIQLIKLNKNYGTTFSRNIALKNITNEDFVCILDSDTEVSEEAFIYMIDYLNKNPDVGIVGPSMVNKDNIKQIPYRKFPRLLQKIYKAIPLKHLNKKGEKMENYLTSDNQTQVVADYIISACWLLPLTTFKKVGYFNEKIFYSPEDVEYCIRVWESKLKVIHLKKPLIIHHYQRISKKKFFSKINLSHFYCLLRLLIENKKFLKMRRSSQEWK